MDINSLAESYLSSDKGKKIADNKNAISEIANSDDGKKIMDMINMSDVESSLKSGNTEELKKILMTVLSTDEGKRIENKLKNIIK